MIYQGSVYKNLDTMQDFRVVYVDGDSAYTISTDTKKAKEVPKRESFEELKEMLDDGTLVNISDKIRKSLINLELSEEQRKRRDRRFEVFDELWNDDWMRECLFDPKRRKLFYDTVSEKLKISFSHAQRLTTRFLRRGMSPNSLLDEKGIRTRGKQAKGRKPGPKAAVPGKLSSPEDVENCRKAYTKIVLHGKKSMKKAYNYCLRTYYMEQVEVNGKTEFRYKDPNNRLTYRQFQYNVEEIRDYAKEKENKYGKRDKVNNLDPVKGTIRGKLKGPGSRVEIDATHFPLHLVSQFDRSLVVGKPLLYLGMDVYTGMIVGFVLTLENESWRTTAMLIKNMLTDKTEYCRSLGLDYVGPDDWPYHHMPRLMFGDNGNNKSASLEKAFEGFPVSLKFGKSYKSTDKPFVERKHSRIKSFAKEYLPGAVREKMKSRGTTDPKLGAAMTLPELEVLIAETIIEFNRRSIDGYARTPEMLANNIKASPMELWRYATQRGETELIPLSPGELEILDNKLLPKDNSKRVLHRTGIRFNNFHYIADNEADYDLWEAHVGEKVEIRYNLLDCGYVYFELEGETVRFVLSDDYAEYKGISMAEVEMLRESAEESDARHLLEDDEVDVGLDYLYERAAKEAKEKKRPSVLSKTRQIADVNANKQREIEQNRQMEKGETVCEDDSLLEDTVLENGYDGYDEYDSDFYDQIEEITQERLKGSRNEQ